MRQFIEYALEYFEGLKKYSYFELYFHLLFCAFFGWGLSFIYVITFFRRVMNFGQAFQFFFYPVLIGVSSLFFIASIVKKLCLTDYLFAITYIAILVFAYKSEYVDYVPNFVKCGTIKAFPIYFLGVLVRFDKLLLKGLLLFSIFDVLFFLFLFFTFRGVYFDYENSDSMAFAYYLFPCVLFLALNYELNRNPTNLLLFLSSFTFQIGLGTRGPIFLVLLFVIFLELISKKSFKRVFAVLICLIFLVVLGSSIMNRLEKNFETHSMSTRVFDKIDQNTLFDDSGRGHIKTITLDYIYHNKWGYGFFSSYKLLGVYPHSIYLEILLQFGYVVGSILLFSVLLLICRSVYLLKMEYPIELRYLYWLIVFVVMRLFSSWTYTMDGFFFLLLGLSNNVIRNSDSLKEQSM